MRILLATLLLSTFAFGASHLTRAEPVPLWTVDFDSVGTVPQLSISRPELIGGGSGAGLILAIPAGGFSRSAAVARIDGNGSPLWLGQPRTGLITGTAPKTRVLSDGSVLVIIDTVYRYSSSGQLLWVAPTLTGPSSRIEIIEVGGVLFLASAGGNQPAAIIDRASGRTLETLTQADLGFSNNVGLAAVGVDTVYSFDASGLVVRKFRLNPLRLEWTVSLQTAATRLDATLPCCGSSPIVADASGAYVAGFSAVFKVSPVDGSVLWSQSLAPDSVDALDADPANPADVLAVGPNRVTSLARFDGVPRWNHVPTGTISAYASFDDSVAVVGNAAPGEPTANPGFLERIRRDDGTVLWQQPITGSAGTESSVYGVGVDAGRISASGVQCENGQAPELCELVIWITSVDGGALSMSKPMLSQSVKFAASAGDAATSVAAAEVATPNGQRILVRRVRNSDGVVLWETSILASLPNAPGRAIQELNIVLTRSASSDVVVGFGRRPAGAVTPQPTGDAVLVKLNGSDGVLQWRRSLLNSSDGFTETAASPFSVETDASGNVLASMHEVRPNVVSGLWGADRREVRTYSSATGEELLRVAFQPTHSPSGSFLPALPWFQVVGDVLITGEPPLPRTDFGVFGIDPTSGSVLWNSIASYLWQPFLSDGSVAFSAYAQATPSPLIRLSRFDASTGNVAWESTYGHPSDPVYTQPVTSRGSDNGVYLGTTSRMFPNAPTSQDPYTARILRADDASGTITWVNRFDNGPVPPQSLARPLFGNNGVLVTVQPAIRASASRGSFLTGMSEADGTFQGTSVLAFDNFGWPQLSTTTFGLRDLAADGAMIVRRSGDMPGQPTQFSLRKLPFPQTFSGGSLRVSLSQSVATKGTQKTAQFRFDVVNDGSVSATAVETIIGLPKLAIIDIAECTIAGSPCTVEATPALFRSVTDIAVGEHLVLTGKIRFLASSAASEGLEASAFSTVGLVEMDMKDNIAAINLADVLFRAGFE